jgi:hypothetical protein
MRINLKIPKEANWASIFPGLVKATSLLMYTILLMTSQLKVDIPKQ